MAPAVATVVVPGSGSVARDRAGTSGPGGKVLGVEVDDEPAAPGEPLPRDGHIAGTGNSHWSTSFAHGERATTAQPQPRKSPQAGLRRRRSELLRCISTA